MRNNIIYPRLWRCSRECINQYFTNHIRITIMANMSYCRFENTSSDLQDCVYAIEECEELSDSEYRAAKRMRELCEQYIDLYDDYIEQHNN